VCRFRDYQVAAPLKRDERTRDAHRIAQFPRLPSRGPIEAWTCPLASDAVRPFPRLPSRGPIEACRSSATSSAPTWFPRLPSRGPIEASQARCSSSGRGGFPRLPSRGPIEAAHNGKTACASRRFPRLPSRGPIEAAIACFRPSTTRGFRDYQVAAPLKHRPNHGKVGRGAVSATTKSRPH